MANKKEVQKDTIVNKLFERDRTATLLITAKFIAGRVNLETNIIGMDTYQAFECAKHVAEELYKQATREGQEQANKSVEEQLQESIKNQANNQTNNQ